MPISSAGNSSDSGPSRSNCAAARVQPVPVRQRRASAFTLVELLVVLAILGLMAAVIPPLFTRALPHSQLKSATRYLASGMKTARNRAITSQGETVLVVDVENRTYAIDSHERSMRLPDEVVVTLETAASELDRESGNRGAIRFFPDGSSTGGRVTLAYRQFEYLVEVNWLTGRVTILP